MIAFAGGLGTSVSRFRALAVRSRLGSCGHGLNRRPDQVWHHKVRVQCIFCSPEQQLVLISSTLVEDHPSGYPRFSALIGTHSSFYVCRRFSTLRARLLLQKQDRIVKLEHHLQHIDEEELQPLFLGSLRRDRNQGRERVLADIDAALQDYGEAVTRIS